MKKYFNLKPSEDHRDHLTYSSRVLYDLFVNHFKLGPNAYQKNMDNFLDLDKNQMSYILKGYFDGDGSVSNSDLRVTYDSVSEKLLSNLTFVLGRYGIYPTLRTYTKEPGPVVGQFYINKKRKIPKFTITKGTINSKFAHRFYSKIGFGLSRKKKILENIVRSIKPCKNKVDSDEKFAYPKITKITTSKEETYCLNVERNHNFICNDLLVKNCDGDESCFILLMDAFVNFSRKYLPSHTGSTMDAPLVLTSVLAPAEVDDMAFDIDIVWKYPLEFYEACEEYKKPWDVKIEQIGEVLNTPRQYEKMGFTHDTANFNDGVLCSSYKLLPSMEDKLKSQMALAEKLRCVDENDVAKLVIEKHFLRDVKGNLRKFSQQKFRCVKCNESYRRPPLVGKCLVCQGKIIFTISEGSIVKYLGP